MLHGQKNIKLLKGVQEILPLISTAEKKHRASVTT